MGIGLPAFLVAPGEVAAFAGGANSVGYMVAFIGPFLGGWLWDVSGMSAFSLIPVAVASLVLVVLGALLPPMLRQRATLPVLQND